MCHELPCALGSSKLELFDLLELLFVMNETGGVLAPPPFPQGVSTNANGFYLPIMANKEDSNGKGNCCFTQA